MMDTSKRRNSGPKIAIGIVIVLGVLLTLVMARGSYRIGTGRAFGNYIRGVEPEYSAIVGSELHDAAVAAASRTGMIYAATTILSTTVPLTGVILAAIWTATSTHVRLRNVLYAGLVCTLVAAVAMGVTPRIIDSGDFAAGFAGGIMIWLFVISMTFVTTLLLTRKKRRLQRPSREQPTTEPGVVEAYDSHAQGADRDSQ